MWRSPASRLFRIAATILGLSVTIVCGPALADEPAPPIPAAPPGEMPANQPMPPGPPPMMPPEMMPMPPALMPPMAAPPPVQNAQAADLYVRGQQALAQKDFEQAGKMFTQANKIEPNNPDILNQLAYCCLKVGRSDWAFTYYNQALKLRPNFPEARANLGEAHLQSALYQIRVLQQSGPAGQAPLRELAEAIRNAAENLPEPAEAPAPPPPQPPEGVGAPPMPVVPPMLLPGPPPGAPPEGAPAPPDLPPGPPPGEHAE